VGTLPKKLAILKQLQTHFKAKLQKGVGTLFPSIPAPPHPWKYEYIAHWYTEVKGGFWKGEESAPWILKFDIFLFNF